MSGSEGRDLNWSPSMGNPVPWEIHTSHPHVKGSQESGHGQVGNETTGMQTTKVAEAISLK